MVFLDKSFNFQPYVFNACHDVLMMPINDVAILNIHDAAYHCIISGVSKSDAINVVGNINLTEKTGTL